MFKIFVSIILWIVYIAALVGIKHMNLSAPLTFLAVTITLTVIGFILVRLFSLSQSSQKNSKVKVNQLQINEK